MQRRDGASSQSPIVTRLLPPSLLIAFAPLFWAGNFVVGRALRGEIQPVALSFWRWAIALLILLPIGMAGLRRDWPTIRANWLWIAVLGATGVAAFQTCVYLALTTTTAINALLFVSICPLLILLGSWIVFRDAVTIPQFLGIVVSIVGAAIVIARGSITTLMELQFNRGDLWMLVAVLVWAIYSVLLKRRPARLGALSLLTATVIVGVLILLPLYGWQVAQGQRFALTTTTLLALLYVAIFASVIAFICWNAGVAALGPNRASGFIHLMPIFGAVLSITFLDERIAVFHLVGAAFVITGIALASWQRRSAVSANART